MPKKWEYWVYPDLRRFDESEQTEALRKAKKYPWDGFEIMGITISIALVVYLTRYSSAGLGPSERVVAAFLNLLVFVVPLVLVSSAPFFIRRVRRGLAAQLKERETSTPEER